MQRRNILKALSAVIAGAAIVTSLGAHADDKVIKVGTIGGPDAQIWEVVTKVAKREGLNVKVVEFNDYVQPNAALDAGDLDANSFQHQPYLDSQIKQRGYKIVNAGLTYISPLGIYSKKLKSLKDLPQGAKVAVPNDPSNENRALLLLQTQGVIKLKAGAGTNGNNATALDVAENPKKIKLVELDAAQLPRSLADVDAAAINTNFALSAGLQPTKDAIALEDIHSPYANLIAVRTQDKDKPWVKKLVAAYQSEDVRQFIKTQFKGSVVPSFSRGSQSQHPSLDHQILAATALRRRAHDFETGALAQAPRLFQCAGRGQRQSRITRAPREPRCFAHQACADAETLHIRFDPQEAHAGHRRRHGDDAHRTHHHAVVISDDARFANAIVALRVGGDHARKQPFERSVPTILRREPLRLSMHEPAALARARRAQFDHISLRLVAEQSFDKVHRGNQLLL